MSGTSEIQKLLEAEHKAQGIVKDARAYRTSRLKASKTDAIAEVNKYKADKEKEFTTSSASAHTGDEHVEKLAEEQSKKEIAELEKKAQKGSSTVVDFLVSTLTSTAA